MPILILIFGVSTNPIPVPILQSGPTLCLPITNFTQFATADGWEGGDSEGGDNLSFNLILTAITSNTGALFTSRVAQSYDL